MSLPEIKTSSTHGQGLFATRAYSTGDCIIADLKPSTFRAIHAKDLDTTCYHCLNPLDPETHHIECPTCHKVRFCGRLCQARAGGAGHKLECLYFIENDTNEPFLAVLRLVLLHGDGRLGTFRLQEFIDLYANDADKYSGNIRERTTQMAAQIRFEIVSALDTRDIEKLFYVFRTNAHALYSPAGKPIGSQVLPLLARSNHACNANTGLQVIKGNSSSMDFVACRDIEPGEELTINYVAGDLSLAERQQKLREIWFFDCRCVKCRLQEAQNEQLRADADNESEQGRRTSLCCFDCT